MPDDTQKPAEPPTSSKASSNDEQPEIYGITKGKNGIALNRRSFLGALAATGALASCVPLPGFGDSDPAAPPAKADMGKAHESTVTGLVLRDTSLFSWSESILKSWDIAKGSLQKSIPKSKLAETFKQAGTTFPVLFSRLWEDSLLAFGSKGESLAVRGKDKITLWKTVNGKPVKTRTLTGLPANTTVLAIHPDGGNVAAAGVNGDIVVWLGGKKHQFKGGTSMLHCLAFHPTEPILLSGHSDGKVREWLLPDGKAGKTLDCHSRPVLPLGMTPDGKLLVTAGEDATVKLWNLPDATLKISLDVPQGDTPYSMGLATDGGLLAIGTRGGRIYLWQLPGGEMAGCLFDPALLDKGTPMSQYRQMSGQTYTQPCDQPLPIGATCLCDCVAASRACRTTQQICTCDTIAVPAGYAGGGVCVCNTILVGTRVRPAPARTKPSCSCVGHVTHGGGHYWRPN